MIHHTTKYDNSLHYLFETELLYQSKKTLVVFTPSGVSLESYRGKLKAQSNMLMFYFRDHLFNVHIHWNQDWSPKMHYVNIASHAKWSDKKISAIDLDLDLIRFSGTDEIILDDEDEFLAHSTLYNYPKDLIQKCWNEVDILRQEMTLRQGLWCDDIFDWRPGKPLPDLYPP